MPRNCGGYFSICSTITLSRPLTAPIAISESSAMLTYSVPATAENTMNASTARQRPIQPQPLFAPADRYKPCRRRAYHLYDRGKKAHCGYLQKFLFECDGIQYHQHKAYYDAEQSALSHLQRHIGLLLRRPCRSHAHIPPIKYTDIYAKAQKNMPGKKPGIL